MPLVVGGLASPPFLPVASRASLLPATTSTPFAVGGLALPTTLPIPLLPTSRLFWPLFAITCGLYTSGGLASPLTLLVAFASTAQPFVFAYEP